MEVSLPYDVFSILLDMKMVPGHLAECLRSVLFFFFKKTKFLCWAFVAMHRLLLLHVGFL